MAALSSCRAPPFGVELVQVSVISLPPPAAVQLYSSWHRSDGADGVVY